MAKIEDRAVYLKANSLNKTLYQAIVDGDFSGGGGGSSPIELFNHTININGGSYSSLTGLNYFRAPSGKTISNVKLQVWTLNGVSSGTLSIDMKKNTTPDGAGMSSMFSVQPTIDFATALDYDVDSGTLSTSTFSAGDFIRLDVTSIPSGFVGTISIMVYA